MKWSLYTADRSTHVRFLVVGLSTTLLISVMGIGAPEMNRGVDIMTAQAPTVIKAGAPFIFTDREGQSQDRVRLF